MVPCGTGSRPGSNSLFETLIFFIPVKVKVAPGKSYSARDKSDDDDEEEEEEEEEEETETDVDELLENVEVPVASSDESEEEVMPTRTANKTSRTLSSSEDEEEHEEDDDGFEPVAKEILYPVGSYCIAVYDQNWYVAQVEAEEPENECEGFTLLRYMERKGANQFVWGKAVDTLKTINRDILLRVEPPIPVSSRFFGVPKSVAKEADKLLMVMWSIIRIFILRVMVVLSACLVLYMQVVLSSVPYCLAILSCPIV
jgi:hypothetical protein